MYSVTNFNGTHSSSIDELSWLINEAQYIADVLICRTLFFIPVGSDGNGVMPQLNKSFHCVAIVEIVKISF